MPKKSEAKVTESIINHIKKLRREGEKIYWLKVHGNAYQRSGTPDLHVTLDGMSLWIEIKKEAGGVISTQQNIELDKWELAGSTVAVVRSLEEFKSALKIARNRRVSFSPD